MTSCVVLFFVIYMTSCISLCDWYDFLYFSLWLIWLLVFLFVIYITSCISLCDLYDFLYFSLWFIWLLVLLFVIYMTSCISLCDYYDFFRLWCFCGIRYSEYKLVPHKKCIFVGSTTFVPIHDWAHKTGPTRLCPDTIVPRHDCAQTRLCPDTFVPRHDCAQTRLWPGTLVPQHELLWSNTIMFLVNNNIIIVFTRLIMCQLDWWKHKHAQLLLAKRSVII